LRHGVYAFSRQRPNKQQPVYCDFTSPIGISACSVWKSTALVQFVYSGCWSTATILFSHVQVHSRHDAFIRFFEERRVHTWSHDLANFCALNININISYTDFKLGMHAPGAVPTWTLRKIFEKGRGHWPRSHDPINFWVLSANISKKCYSYGLQIFGHARAVSWNMLAKFEVQ